MPEPKTITLLQFQKLEASSKEHRLTSFVGTIESIIESDGNVRSLRIRGGTRHDDTRRYIVRAYSGLDSTQDPWLRDLLSRDLDLLSRDFGISRHYMERGDEFNVIGQILPIDESLPLIQAHHFYNSTAGVGFSYNPQMLDVLETAAVVELAPRVEND